MGVWKRWEGPSEIKLFLKLQDYFQRWERSLEKYYFTTSSFLLSVNVKSSSKRRLVVEDKEGALKIAVKMWKAKSLSRV